MDTNFSDLIDTWHAAPLRQRQQFSRDIAQNLKNEWENRVTNHPHTRSIVFKLASLAQRGPWGHWSVKWNMGHALEEELIIGVGWERIEEEWSIYDGIESLYQEE